MLVADEREVLKRYSEPDVFFGTAPTALLQGLAQTPECEVDTVSCVQKPVRTPVQVAENICSHSIVVPKWGWLRGGYLGCIRAVRQKLRVLEPDVVHAQGTERDCGMSAIFSGFPNVLTIHGNQRSLAKLNRAKPLSFAWLTARLESFVLPRADGVICITTFTRRLVENLARKTWVVPNAVDASFFEVQRSPSSQALVLCVGFICPHKNQNRLICALDSVAQRHSFLLVFLGQADRSTDYGRAFFRLVETRPWCRYEGFADRSGLKRWLQQAALLILPSLADNCPMVVLEAAAAGVPVAAAEIGGLPDLIESEATGLLFDPTADDSISAAVAKLLLNRDYAGGLAIEARMRAKERFHPQNIARRHLNIYSEVASSRPSATPTLTHEVG